MKTARFAVFFLTMFFLALRFGAMAGDMEGHGGGHGMVDAEWGDADDAAFLSAMIVHHEGALKMAGAAAKTSDPDVARWAKAIRDTQQKEIDLMQSLLKDVGGEDEEAAAMMRREMRSMMENRADQDPDVNFVLLMIPHHAGAVDMSLPALVMTEKPEVRKLARDIITAQAAEIAEFRDWLDKRGDG